MSENIQNTHNSGEVLAYFSASETEVRKQKKRIVSLISNYIQTFSMKPEEIVKYLEGIRGRVEEIEKQTA